MNDKKADFNYFMKCLIKAGTKIDSHYFKLFVAGAENPIFRERVYCYELYHQLRCTLGDGFPYKLDGEVDKNAHPFIQGAKKPDFIIHVPGSMEKNLAVIEVKSTDAESNEIKQDIKKLKGFLEADYYRAIMLIYGDDSSKVEHARSEIDSLPKAYAERILLLWHKQPKEPVEVV